MFERQLLNDRPRSRRKGGGDDDARNTVSVDKVRQILYSPQHEVTIHPLGMQRRFVIEQPNNGASVVAF